FWHTGQFVNGGSPATRIYSFDLPLPTDLKEASKELAYQVYQNNNTLIVNADNLKESGQFVVDLFDVQGRKLEGQNINVVDGKLRTDFAIANYAKGIYMVRIGKPNTSFQKVIKVSVN
ncbi:MAG: T9SS type A sorting domain-containing protein, partial [Bacteroidota bacterium]